jgi:toxin ParE1/3/4
MKKSRVKLTKDALQDIVDVYRFISEKDSEQVGRKIFEAIKKKCYELVHFPEKGHIPPELDAISITKYLEINFKIYRIFYYIEEHIIYIIGIFDGRRNLMDVLTKRLLK